MARVQGIQQSHAIGKYLKIMTVPRKPGTVLKKTRDGLEFLSYEMTSYYLLLKLHTIIPRFERSNLTGDIFGFGQSRRLTAPIGY